MERKDREKIHNNKDREKETEREKMYFKHFNK